MAVRPDVVSVRVAELVATLSYAADLGLGQPMEHCMRQTVIAQRLADLAGAGESDREASYYLGLLMNTSATGEGGDMSAARVAGAGVSASEPGADGVRGRSPGREWRRERSVAI